VTYRSAITCSVIAEAVLRGKWERRGKIRPGNWVVLADRIQNKAAMDVAGGLAPGNAKIVEINFAHKTS
jgi:hypothetical protein